MKATAVIHTDELTHACSLLNAALSGPKDNRAYAVFRSFADIMHSLFVDCDEQAAKRVYLYARQTMLGCQQLVGSQGMELIRLPSPSLPALPLPEVEGTLETFSRSQVRTRRIRRSSVDISKAASVLKDRVEKFTNGIRSEELRQKVGWEKTIWKKTVDTAVKLGYIHKRGFKRGTTFYPGSAESVAVSTKRLRTTAS